VSVPRLDVPVGRLSGGQRQAIAVARAVHSEADVLLLDEPLAAMGAREGAMILHAIERLRSQRRVSIILIAHNYSHILQSCDRVAMIQGGTITFNKATAETSVSELDALGAEEYRRAHEATRDP
jgi:ABC-type sugar transport system ATPase subunit